MVESSQVTEMLEANVIAPYKFRKVHSKKPLVVAGQALVGGCQSLFAVRRRSVRSGSHSTTAVLTMFSHSC